MDIVCVYVFFDSFGIIKSEEGPAVSQDEINGYFFFLSFEREMAQYVEEKMRILKVSLLLLMWLYAFKF